MDRISDVALDLGPFKLDSELETLRASQKGFGIACTEAGERAFGIYADGLKTREKVGPDGRKSKRRGDRAKLAIIL